MVYIDGFNLYFGLREARYRRFYWLDVAALARRLLRQGQELARVKYFTARVSEPTAKRERQQTFLEALETRSAIDLFYGRYQYKTVSCRQCGASWLKPEEKMTDVQIATQMLLDAHGGAFDTAIVVSGDSDLVPPIRAIKATFPMKRIVVAFPPRRSSNQLRQEAHAAFVIGRKVLKDSQLPDRVTKAGGQVLVRPQGWR